jgi:plastocyanin
LGTGATPDDLVYFGKSSYSEPKFSWITPIGITALKFLNSDKLGKQYQNNMFVGDINNGLLYRFILNDARNDLSFDNGYTGNASLLADREINDPKENQPIVFGQGFGGISDIEVGPDGYMYVLSFTGTLFRILPASSSSSSNNSTSNANVEDQGQKALQQGLDGISEEQSSSSKDNSIPVVITGINGENSYSPNPIQIEKGQTITWYNGDTISHTVTSGNDGDKDAGEAFDSNAIIPNQYYSLTFDDSGTYNYYCIYHPSMVGQIEVH